MKRDGVSVCVCVWCLRSPRGGLTLVGGLLFKVSGAGDARRLVVGGLAGPSGCRGAQRCSLLQKGSPLF